MDQINHIGRPCDSELRFCSTAQRFWTQQPSARLAGWLADARNRSSCFPWAHQADGHGKDDEATSLPSIPSPHPSRDKWWERLWCGRCGEGWSEWCGWRVNLCQPGLGWITHSWAGLAWPEAGCMRRGAGQWFGDIVAMEVPDSGAVW